MKSSYLIFSLIAFLIVNETANAQESGQKSTVTVSGYVDSYYSYNFQKPSSFVNQLRNFDMAHNQVSLNLIKVRIDKKAEPLGFRIDLGYGSSVDVFNVGDTNSTLKVVEQAYGTLVLESIGGLTIDVGKFGTHMGAEVIETNANWNYSRSLLFAWAIPYHHTGVRMTYPVTKSLNMMGMIANGWNNTIESNKQKTFGAQIAWNFNPQWNFYLNWINGPEQAGTTKYRRQVWDAIAQGAVMDNLIINLNFDYGTEAKAGSDAMWWGVATMAKYQISDSWAVAVRGEQFDDADGNQTTVSQKIKEVTATLEMRPFDRCLVRTEFRRDWSTKAFFDGDSPASKKQQNTILLGTIFEF